jgi:hypothetical protein
MRRRVQIQPDDVGRVGLKVRIVRRHVALDPMRFESVLAPDSSHHHVADGQVSAEFACAPVRRPIARRTARRLQDPRFEFRREHRGHLAQMPAIEPAIRCSTNRLFQLATKPRLHSIRSDTSSHVWPSANSKISRAPRASFARSVQPFARRVNSIRSAFVNLIASVMDASVVAMFHLTHQGQNHRLLPIKWRFSWLPYSTHRTSRTKPLLTLT